MKETEAQQDFCAARSNWSSERTGSYGESVALKRMSESAFDRAEEVRAELVAMISALRDELATRFNALADKIDKLKGTTITEASVENASENWNTCACGHHGSAHDLRNRCLVEGCPCRCFATIRQSVPAVGADAATEKEDQNAPKQDPLDPVVLGIAQAYQALRDAKSSTVGAILRDAYRAVAKNSGLSIEDVHATLLFYGLGIDA